MKIGQIENQLNFHQVVPQRWHFIPEINIIMYNYINPAFLFRPSTWRFFVVLVYFNTIKQGLYSPSVLKEIVENYTKNIVKQYSKCYSHPDILISYCN